MDISGRTPRSILSESGDGAHRGSRQHVLGQSKEQINEKKIDHHLVAPSRVASHEIFRFIGRTRIRSRVS